MPLVVPKTRLRHRILRSPVPFREPHVVDGILKKIFVEGACANCTDSCCRRHWSVGVHRNDRSFHNVLMLSADHGGMDFYGQGTWLLPVKDRVCKFLKQDSCGIYSSRPDVCRIFPFGLDETHFFTYVTLFRTCPLVGRLRDAGVSYVYGQELVRHDSETGKFVPLVPILGNALVTILTTESPPVASPLVRLWNTDYGPIFPLVMPRGGSV
ncbi:MAG: YkgJ family cysteine cluster protein [Candidatus Micrarchaeota archaeon]